MTPVRQAITATGNGPPILLDFFSSPFNATVGVDLSQAVGATYGIFFTLSDINSLVNTAPGDAVVTPLWRPDVTLAPGSTASGVTFYPSPVMYVRITVTTLTSGTIFVEALQTDSSRR